MDNSNVDDFRYKYNLLGPPIWNAEAILDNIGIPNNVKLFPRRLFLKIGSASTNTRGSAYMEYGNTKVMVHVDTPKEIANPSGISDVICLINCSVKYSPLIYDDADVITQKEHYMNFILRKTLESVVCLQEFLNFQLDINVIIIDDDGCALSTAINCCGLALISAGMPIYDLPVSSAICYLNQTEYINPSADVEDAVTASAQMDYDADESQTKEHGIVTVSSMFTCDQINHYSQQGFMRVNTLERLCDYATTINRRLYSILRQALSKTFGMELAFERHKNDENVDVDDGNIIDSK